MSYTLIIGLIFATICILYGWASFSFKKQDSVLEVEAGPIDDCCKLLQYNSPSKSVRLTSGRYVNTSDFIRILIHGNCMTPRNIVDGEEWLVEPININKDVKSQIKVRDVLLLYIEDKKSYIIREFNDFDVDGTLKTIRYDQNKTVKPSSKNHRLEQVRGIVRFAI